jgi:hypothetical protein
MAPRQGQYGHGGAQDHADEHGPRNGPIDPQPLGLHGKICPHLFIRDRCRPAPDHLLEDLCGGGLGVWAEQGGHAPFPLRIAHAHKAHGHRWPLRSRPQSSAREHPEPVPLPSLAVDVRGLRPALPAVLGRPRGWLTAALAWGLGCWRMISGGIPALARDLGLPAMRPRTASATPLRHSHRPPDQVSSRLTAASLCAHMPPPSTLVLGRSCLSMLCRPATRRHEGIYPHPLAPKPRHQEPHCHPY